jgi:uncharacterized membrane protein YidH (DUF202 family)
MPTSNSHPPQTVSRWPRIHLTAIALTLLLLAQAHVHTARARWARRFGESGDDAGSPTVETIGWVSFALVIVVVLGTILRAKLVAFANSLPTALNW